MKENIIKTKSFQFALEIITFYKFLIEHKKEFVMSKQILRSGTAIGALVSESEHAQSKLDFINKLSIAQKEANETEYRIELLYQSYYYYEQVYNDMKNKLLEIQKIISSIIITTKNNLKK